MTARIISTIDDLRIYLGDAFELSRDDASAAAERLSRASDRPYFGDDWTEYLGTLTPEVVHGSSPKAANPMTAWAPDLEAIGAVVYVGSGIRAVDDLLPERFQALGKTDHGWRPDAMLRAIWRGASEGTKAVLQNLIDSGKLPRHVVDELLGEFTSL